jgi:hypothetical protein
MSLASAPRICGLLFVALLALAACDRGPAAIDRGRLLSAAGHPDPWLTTGGDFGKTHYSGLSAIDVGNVARLGI